MITYTFLQHYWWFLVSLLGGLLVFLLFVQGGNSLIFALGRDEAERSLLINSTGRKWEFTFTTLVTFGGAFFASFPLFYSTSFGGAYWVWVLILLSFVLQAVAYEYQSKPGNVLGRTTYRRFLVANGCVGPFLLGDGYAVDADGHIVLTPYKYALNLVQMPAVGATFLVGVALVLHGLLRTLWKPGFRRGIWSAGFGTVLAVTALLLAAGYNGTAYYPSTVSPGSSLTIANSSSSYFTLKTMAWVSLLIPVVVAYIAYAWYAIDRQSLTRKELEKGEHKY